MNRLVMFAIILALVIGLSQPIIACSSFAVYNKNGPVFGMNWDVPTREEARTSSAVIWL